MAVSISITGKEERFSTISSISNSIQALNKDIETLQTEMQLLSGKERYLQSALAESNAILNERSDALKEATKNQKDFNDEISRANLDRAREDAEQAAQEVKQWTAEISRNRAEYKSLQDELSRGNNRVEGSKSLEKLAGSGLRKMVGDSLSGMLDFGFSSTFGASTGNTISTIFSGAATGAAMGSVAGLHGAVIGAGVGIVTGIIDATTQYLKETDDMFRAKVRSVVAEAEERIRSDLLPGVVLSQQQTSYLQYFSTSLPDSFLKSPEEFLQKLSNIDKGHPSDFGELVAQSKLLIDSGMEENDIFLALRGIGQAAVINGIGAQDTNLLVETIGSMGNSESLTTEQADIFARHGIPIQDYLAQQLSNPPENIEKAIADGLVSGKEAQKSIIKSMWLDAELRKAPYILRNTLEGIQSMLDIEYDSIKRRMGDGYSEAAIEAKKNELNILESGLGDAMGGVHGIIGRDMGEQDALKQEYSTAVKDFIINGGEMSDLFINNPDQKEGKQQQAYLEDLRRRYQEGDPQAMKYILAAAEDFAEMAFESSPYMEEEHRLQLDYIRNVQKSQAIHEDIIKNEKDTENLLSTGFGAAKLALKKTGPGENDYDFESFDREDWSNYRRNIIEQNASINGVGQKLQVDPALKEKIEDQFNPSPSLTTLLLTDLAAQIPIALYNNDELRQWLTSFEARPYEVNISGNTFTVREEADIDKIAQALAAELERAQLVS